MSLPQNYSANMVFGLLPVLSSADLLDAVAHALNELNRRGDKIELRDGKVIDRWAEIEQDDAGSYRPVFYDSSIAEQATTVFGPSDGAA